MLLNEAIKILNGHKKDLVQLGVQTLALFGSVAKNKGTSTSDVDILIDFDSKRGMFGFLDLKSYLEKLLDCKVDLVTKRALHLALKEKILQEAKRVF